MKAKHSAIVQKREEEVRRRLSATGNGKQDGPMLHPGTIVYEVSDKIRGISCGSLGLLQQLVKTVGLAEAINQGVTVFKRHQPYPESDHVLSLIYNVSSGGTRLQDVESRRENVSYLEALGAEKIPAPSTTGDFLRRFSGADVVDLMEAVNEPRLKVWRRQAGSFLERADPVADDCEIHIAGTSEGLPLGLPSPIVIEPPNLCKFPPAGTKKKVSEKKLREEGLA